MPGLYDYQCKKCGHEFDMILPFNECDAPQACPRCGGHTKKQICLGHGGILRTGDSSPWVRSVAKFLGDGDSTPNIESVQDLRQYYKDHPNCRPKESHPAFPSSYGDALNSRPDEKAFKEKRSRRAHEKLREMRSITVTGQAAAQPR